MANFKYCPRCGHQNSPDPTSCANCGRTFRQSYVWHLTAVVLCLALLGISFLGRPILDGGMLWYLRVAGILGIAWVGLRLVADNFGQTFRAYWTRLSDANRALVVLLCMTLVVWLLSYLVGYGYTTASRLDTFMLYDGQITWNHRSAAGADYVTAVGPSKGFALFWTGALYTSTTHGEHLWVFFMPFSLLALIFGLSPLISLYRILRTPGGLRRKGDPAERPAFPVGDMKTKG